MNELLDGELRLTVWRLRMRRVRLVGNLAAHLAIDRRTRCDNDVGHSRNARGLHDGVRSRDIHLEGRCIDVVITYPKWPRRQVNERIGTTLLEKSLESLDFPNVRVVGVISADTALRLTRFFGGEPFGFRFAYESRR